MTRELEFTIVITLIDSETGKEIAQEIVNSGVDDAGLIGDIESALHALTSDEENE